MNLIIKFLMISSLLLINSNSGIHSAETKSDINKNVYLSGWINKKRDHGNLLFIDLRDNYGITQCIIDKENKNFSELEKKQLETVIKVKGKVVNR